MRNRESKIRELTTFNLQLRTDTLATMQERSDELWMEEALREARRAEALGEVPVGAVIICDDKIVARAANRNLTDNDPTAHAEILALRQAGTAVGNHRLLDCEMFVTIEPCPMCAGALVHARLKRLVYGADDPKAGAVSSVMQVLNHPQLNHRMEVTRGVLAARCMDLLQEFFRRKRERAPAGETT
jgi:tRNA(adenine34) deaminase